MVRQFEESARRPDLESTVLMKKLGFAPYEFRGHPIAGYPQEFDCGKVERNEFPKYSVQVTAQATPAVFWEFDVRYQEWEESSEQHYTIKTGTLPFSKYWPTIEYIITGMMDITRREDTT